MQVPAFLTIALLLTVAKIDLLAQIVIFPELSGEELREAIIEEYKPNTLLSFTQTKDTLYAKIEMRDDSVHGIYTDFTLYLPPGQDPSQAMYMNGVGINLEHCWPQSLGAGDGRDGQRNLHHLFPTRVAVNSSRANLPFGEINDQSADKWYYKNLSLTSIPSSNIDLYSERVNGLFEPRESVKGDVARAMFYFYTMYKDDADQEDPNFFNDQMATFCLWHELDPADENELARSKRVAVYQDGKENPFIMDCSLVQRIYCPDNDDCSTVATSNARHPELNVSLSQKGCDLTILLEANASGQLTNSIVSSNGQVISHKDTTVLEGLNTIEVNACDFPQGIYFLTSEFTENGNYAFKTLKFVISQ